MGITLGALAAQENEQGTSVHRPGTKRPWGGTNVPVRGRPGAAGPTARPSRRRARRYSQADPSGFGASTFASPVARKVEKKQPYWYFTSSSCP